MKVYHPETCNISSEALIGKGTIIHSHVSIHDQVIIGENCKIQAYAFLPNGVLLEDNVFVGPHVCFTNDPKLDGEIKPTVVRKGAKIGANATIVAGITIGSNAIIGAGSVVTKDIGDNELWYGNPALKRI